VAAVAVILTPATGDRQDEQYHRWTPGGYACPAGSRAVAKSTDVECM